MDVIDRWAASACAGTFDLSLSDADATIWHSHDGVEMTVEDEALLLASSRESFACIRTVDLRTRRHRSGALLEYDLELMAHDGCVSRVPAFAVVTAEDDRIIRIEEQLTEATVRDASEWEVGRRPVADAHDRMMAAITRYGLDRHAVELEIYGFTRHLSSSRVSPTDRRPMPRTTISDASSKRSFPSSTRTAEPRLHHRKRSLDRNRSLETCRH